MLPVGAECDDSRKCISRKCYCAMDPWNRELCNYGSGATQVQGLRKCCFWSWGYWECEGAAMVEDSEERKAQLTHDTPQGFVPNEAVPPLPHDAPHPFEMPGHPDPLEMPDSSNT